MLITCRELIEFLDDYVAGAMPPDRRAQVDEHLAVCPDCVNYVESYKRTVRLGKAAYAGPAGAVAADVPEGLLRAILAARPPRRDGT